jgi:hypothetical protein
MVDVRRLGHSGGAGRVDVKCTVLDGERAPLGGGERRRRESLHRTIDAREILRALAMDPDFRCGLQRRQDGEERLEQFGRDDNVLGRDDIDAMRERRPHEVGVEERGDAADARDADPRGRKFRPVRHQQADSVALLEILRQRPARIAIGALEQLTIGQLLARGDECGLVTVFVRELGDHVGKKPRWILRDMRGHAQRAQAAAQKDDVSQKLTEKPHASCPDCGVGERHHQRVAGTWQEYRRRVNDPARRRG